MEIKINLSDTHEKPRKNEYNIVTKETKNELSTLKDSFEKRKEAMELKDKVWNKVDDLSTKIQTMNIPDSIKSMVNFNKLKPQFDKYINQIEDPNDIITALSGIDNMLIKVKKMVDKVSEDPKNISFSDIKGLKDSFEKQHEEIIGDISLESKDKIEEYITIIGMVIGGIIALIIGSIALEGEFILFLGLEVALSFSGGYIGNNIVGPEITKDLVEETTKNYILDTLDDKINDEYIDKEDFIKLYNFVYSHTDLNNITNGKFKNILSKSIEEYTNTYGKIKSETDFKKFIDYAIISFKNYK